VRVTTPSSELRLIVGEGRKKRLGEPFGQELVNRFVLALLCEPLVILATLLSLARVHETRGRTHDDESTQQGRVLGGNVECGTPTEGVPPEINLTITDTEGNFVSEVRQCGRVVGAAAVTRKVESAHGVSGAERTPKLVA
jgi:hypothetical protein